MKNRAAVVRAAGCLQLEIDSEGKDIQVFSLHPGKAEKDMGNELLTKIAGGIRTEMNMNETVIHPDVELVRPGVSLFTMWCSVID